MNRRPSPTVYWDEGESDILAPWTGPENSEEGARLLREAFGLPETIGPFTTTLTLTPLGMVSFTALGEL